MSRRHWLELAVLTLLAALAAAWLPLNAGYMGWSWDALNHHVYLGMTAQHPRWDLDVLPASNQTYQYPYLYWPVYRLSLWTGSGAHAGAAWAALQAAILLPPVWLVSYRLLPEEGSAWVGIAERTASCVFAAMSVALWCSLETTANDLLAAAPLIWAVAVGLKPNCGKRTLLGMGLLYGISVAFKLSNALFAPLLLAWWWSRRAPHLPLARAVPLAFGGLVGFLLAYAPWGLQLWRHMGHPFYPFFGR